MNFRRSLPLPLLFLFLFVALVALSCSGPAGRKGSSGQIIVPKPAEGMTFGSSISSTESRSRPPEEIPPVKVPLSSDYLVQQVIDVNLDLDDMDEQIVVFKRREGARSDTHAAQSGAAAANGSSAAAAGGQSGAGSSSAGGSSRTETAPATTSSNGAPAAGVNVAGARNGAAAGPTANGPADAEGTPIGGGSVGTVVNAGETVQDLEARTANDTIWIMVVDFDTVRNTYVIAWEAPTLATNIRTFKVQEKDLLGDHNLEIVCQGLNARGEQTLDVFKRVNSPAGLGLKYQNILSIASDGSTEIQEVDRSDAYHSAQALGKSFPIVTLTRDRESSNPLDMVRTTYFYRAQEGRYVKGVTEKVSGNRIEEAQLSNLYNGTADTFEDFLNGPWYRASGNSADKGQPTAQSVDIMFYDRHGREITFARGDVEQSFTIEES
ncbi:pallilysin-related adhesin, partial [Salinispira pacifica]